MRKTSILIAVLMFGGISATAQRTNTQYVDQFPGYTVGELTTKAQQACSPDVSVPCIIVFDPILTNRPVGVMPAKCSQCFWLDWRTPAALFGAGSFPDPGSNGILVRTAFNVLAIATRANVLALWPGCSGYLKSDGGCDTPAGGGSSAGSQYAAQYNSNGSGGFAAVTPPTTNGDYQLGYHVTGGVAVPPTAMQAGIPGRAVAGTSDTILSTDRASWVTYSSGSATAVTLPQAGTTGFASNFAFGIKATGAGAVTVTPATSTIDGGATLVVTQGQNCSIGSLDGTNYVSRCASGQITAGSNVTITPSANGLSIAASGGGGSVTATSWTNNVTTQSGSEPAALTANHTYCQIDLMVPVTTITNFLLVAWTQSANNADFGLYTGSPGGTCTLRAHTGAMTLNASAVLSRAATGGPVAVTPVNGRVYSCFTAVASTTLGGTTSAPISPLGVTDVTSTTSGGVLNSTFTCPADSGSGERFGFAVN